MSNNTITLRSGAKISRIRKKDLENKCYLTRAMLSQMHLSPVGDPVAYGAALPMVGFGRACEPAQR